MPLDQLERWKGSYENVKYTVKVYFSPESPASHNERLVVIERRWNETANVESVYDSTPLDVSSILPFRDPDPMGKDEQVARAMREFESRVDTYNKQRKRALK